MYRNTSPPATPHAAGDASVPAGPRRVQLNYLSIYKAANTYIRKLLHDFATRHAADLQVIVRALVV